VGARPATRSASAAAAGTVDRARMELQAKAWGLEKQLTEARQERDSALARAAKAEGHVRRLQDELREAHERLEGGCSTTEWSRP